MGNTDCFMQNLKRLRLSSKYSQSEFSKILGCSLTAYSNYENGTREIPFSLAITAVKHFGQGIDELLRDPATAQDEKKVEQITNSISSIRRAMVELEKLKNKIAQES